MPLQKVVNLEEVCTKVTDGTHDSPKLLTEGVPFIKAKHITNGYVDFENSDFISHKDHLKVISRSKPEYNDILFTNIGASIGATAIIKDKREFSIKNVALFKPDKKTIDPDYLFYKVTSEEFQTGIKNHRSGSAQPFVSLGSLREFRFSIIDDVEEQKNISNILLSYDCLIENNSRRIAILEEMAQSLYREWFVKFRFPGYQDCEFKESSLGLIPEEWEVVQIKDIGEVITGKTPSKKNPEYYSTRDVPFLKTPDMHGSIFVTFIDDWLSKEGADSQKNKYIPAGSVSVACIGAKAGVVALIPTSVQTNQQINSVVFYDSRMREYFYLFASGFTKLIRALGSSGATMTNVSKGKFETIELIKPMETIFEDFHNAISPHFNMIMNLQKKNEKLKKARGFILPKLISGAIKLQD